ncbi:aspartate/glutamate racemase family protein [Castellaniella sp.]|uniref:aspartate/glutamate racemase family protein n=1 Tax=Castellaniella sp. TaxID=1955812 RepID=UPI0025C1E7AB|nr:aspartate/glutamate racemase family protein [Castellaniella sp.]
MKTTYEGHEITRVIGLIGGMSWESSAEYYQRINREVRERLGPLRSAKLLLYSVDFGPIEQAQHEGRWDDTASILEDAARRLYRGGADCVVLCTNTMHKVADRVAAAVPIPFLHSALPVLDTTALHARAAVDFALQLPDSLHQARPHHGS